MRWLAAKHSSTQPPTGVAAGATALCFQCVWPSRFGNGLLAAKVLKVSEGDEQRCVKHWLHDTSVLVGVCLDP
jgi:hypothetical protein